MTKTFATALVGLSFALGGLAAPALAQDAAPAAAPAEKPSIEKTPIVDLAAIPAAKAVLEKAIPQLLSHPAYEQFKDMTLRQLQPLSQGALTDDILTAVQADLDKIQ